MVSTPLKLWVRDGLSVLSWAARVVCRPSASGVRILVYHAIAEIAPPQDRWRLAVPPALFAAQLRWLRRHGYAVVSLEEAVAMIEGRRPMRRKAVAITFDDGFQDTLTQAYPMLQRERMPMTLFVVAGCLDAGRPFSWLEHPARFSPPLTWEELQRLAADPLVTIGSHGWSHQCLSALSPSEQARDIYTSQAALEARLGRAVTWFAYPFGHRRSFSAETIGCLQRHRFRAACANVMGLNRVGDSPWTLKRTRIGWEDRLWRFRLKMAGAYDWVDGVRLPSGASPTCERGV